ncbi:MAG: diguanylate cyclase/phosphodiesterase with sensor(s) [Acidimicrobiales bacterium]|nr:diguanylate cyclase/phosphodiesterase with sensor(s) [Acidimicrobiales bacterium]
MPAAVGGRGAGGGPGEEPGPPSTDWMPRATRESGSADGDRLLADYAAILEGIARGSALDDTLNRVATVLEGRLPGVGVAIGVLEDDGVIRYRSAPSLSGDVLAAFSASSPSSSLGVAVRSPLAAPLVIDVGNDARVGHLREVVAAAGYRGIWVLQLRTPRDERVIGILAVLSPHVTLTDTALVPCERSADLAAIAVYRQAFEDRLRHQALHDALTGLPNRQLLLSRIERLVELSAAPDPDAALLFVDLDQFKVINDSLGHAAGDDVLDQVAKRFRAAVRPDDFVGRFGGDEFVVLCEEVGGEDGAIAIAQRLAATLERPFRAARSEVVLSSSIGIALVTDPSVGPDALIRNADAAMYRAKELGRDNYVVFEDDLHARAVRRMQLEQDLRGALAADEIDVWFQPQVRLADGRIVGVEALARWHAPDRPPVAPKEFVPIAEETGLIVALGRRVLERSCAVAAGWRTRPGLEQLPVTVNLAARQLTDPGLLDDVRETLARAGLPPAALCLEVTESALVNDLDHAVNALDQLRAMGIRLAIDDFGTGYATLEHVRRFSMANQLKIDQSFVAELGGASRADRAIVQATVVLAKALGMSTVAEGVETEIQRAVLVELGCDFGQGYLFSRAVPADELARLLAAGILPNPKSNVE